MYSVNFAKMLPYLINRAKLGAFGVESPDRTQLLIFDRFLRIRQMSSEAADIPNFCPLPVSYLLRQFPDPSEYLRRLGPASIDYHMLCVTFSPVRKISKTTTE